MNSSYILIFIFCIHLNLHPLAEVKPILTEGLLTKGLGGNGGPKYGLRLTSKSCRTRVFQVEENAHVLVLMPQKYRIKLIVREGAIEIRY